MYKNRNTFWERVIDNFVGTLERLIPALGAVFVALVMIVLMFGVLRWILF